MQVRNFGYIIFKNKKKQAEAKLGQAQPRLELDVRIEFKVAD